MGGSAEERETRASSTARLEAFSDGVMAIAITLLILEVRVPDVGPHEQLRSALAHEWPSFAAYALSFLTVGIMWANHHQMFRHIERTTFGFLMMNVVFLLPVAFVPFPTAVLAKYLGSDAERTTAVVLYGATFIGIAIMWNVVWSFAVNGRRLVGPEVTADAIRRGTRSYRLGPITYAVGTVVALFNPIAGFAIFVALAVYWLLPGSGPG
jgi:TMEM175 potassium channel family protein